MCAGTPRPRARICSATVSRSEACSSASAASKRAFCAFIVRMKSSASSLRLLAHVRLCATAPRTAPIPRKGWFAFSLNVRPFK